MWVHPYLQTRKTEGEYYTLYRHLIDDEEKFVQYVRINFSTLEMILTEIEPKIKKLNTKFREACSPRQRLMVCLR